jgi:hypothetical protein
MTDLEAFMKQGLPNYDDLWIITERINKIADQTTRLTEAVAAGKFSNITPGRTDTIERVQQ